MRQDDLTVTRCLQWQNRYAVQTFTLTELKRKKCQHSPAREAAWLSYGLVTWAVVNGLAVSKPTSEPSNRESVESEGGAAV